MMTGMPLVLILDRQYSLQNSEAAFCQIFRKRILGQMCRSTGTAVTSGESGIAVAGQDSSLGRICFKTCFRLPQWEQSVQEA